MDRIFTTLFCSWTSPPPLLSSVSEVGLGVFIGTCLNIRERHIAGSGPDILLALMHDNASLSYLASVFISCDLNGEISLVQNN